MTVIRAKVVYARPEHQWIVEVELEKPATIRKAAEKSGLLELASRFEPDGICGAGIRGRVLDWDAPVAEGEYVEIYRQLPEDPRARRRRRAREERKGCGR